MGACRADLGRGIRGVGVVIFVTTGTQLPFPRLIDAMNRIAPDLDEEVIAQIGPQTDNWPALTVHTHLGPGAFADTFRRARLVVAHAGVGTVLSARRYGKPLVILPRRHALCEHRNDHQMATAKHLAHLPGVQIAWNEADLAPLLRRTDLPPATDTPGPGHADLIARLRRAIDD